MLHWPETTIPKVIYLIITFDIATKLGIKKIIIQSKTIDRLNNLVDISHYVKMKDFSFVREVILDYYNIEDSFSLDFSYILIFFVLLQPIMEGDYTNVIMCCGLDESRYSIVANRILNRMGIPGRIGGLYTFVPN